MKATSSVPNSGRAVPMRNIRIAGLTNAGMPRATPQKALSNLKRLAGIAISRTKSTTPYTAFRLMSYVSLWSWPICAAHVKTMYLR